MEYVYTGIHENYRAIDVTLPSALITPVADQIYIPENYPVHVTLPGALTKPDVDQFNTQEICDQKPVQAQGILVDNYAQHWPIPGQCTFDMSLPSASITKYSAASHIQTVCAGVQVPWQHWS